MTIAQSILTKKNFIAFVLIFQGIVTHSQPNFSSMLEDKIRKSDLIIEGQIIEKNSFWDIDHKNIYTSYNLKTVNALKGSSSLNPNLIVKGGIVGDLWQIVSSTREFRIGDKGIFLLKNMNQSNSISNETANRYLLTNGEYGFIDMGNAELKIEPRNEVYDRFEDVKIIERITCKKVIIEPPVKQTKSAQSNHKITGFSPKEVIAGNGTLLSINGSGFANTQGNGEVWFVYADNPNYIFSNAGFEIKLWSDSLIQLNVPSGAGSGKIIVKINNIDAESKEDLTVKFAIKNENNLPIILLDTDSNGGYTWHLNTNISSFSGAKEIIEKSLKEWMCATSIPWRIGNQIIAEPGYDNLCTISFGDVNSSNEETLGQANTFVELISYSNTMVYVLKEVDIVFSNEENWSFSQNSFIDQQIDFESVALHEFGHAHLLGHVNNSEDLMHSGITNGAIQNIGFNNIDCGKLIINNSLAFIHKDYKTVVPYSQLTPDIAAHGDTLISLNKFTSYQWYYNQGEILNATESRYLAMKSGDYYLSATNENGCVKNSNSIFLLKTGNDDLEINEDLFILYPNPTNGELNIEFKPNVVQNISIYNNIGQQVFLVKINGDISCKKIYLSDFKSGIYIIKLQCNKTVLSKKIIVN